MKRILPYTYLKYIPYNFQALKPFPETAPEALRMILGPFRDLETMQMLVHMRSSVMTVRAYDDDVRSGLLAPQSPVGVCACMVPHLIPSGKIAMACGASALLHLVTLSFDLMEML